MQYCYPLTTISSQKKGDGRMINDKFCNEIHLEKNTCKQDTRQRGNTESKIIGSLSALPLFFHRTNHRLNFIKIRGQRSPSMNSLQVSLPGLECGWETWKVDLQEQTEDIRHRLNFIAVYISLS